MQVDLFYHIFKEKATPYSKKGRISEKRANLGVICLGSLDLPVSFFDKIEYNGYRKKRGKYIGIFEYRRYKA